MPDAFTDTPGGDELDFRPLPSQPTPRKAAPQPRMPISDGIDFQPSTSTPNPQRAAATSASSEIDFRPAEKPATLDKLYSAPQSSVSPTEQAARVGYSPLVQSFAPKFV